MEEYKSLEQKIGDFLMPVASVTGRFLKNFIPLSYGTVAGFFRIPTTIRKNNNHQTICHRLDKDYNKQDFASDVGVSLGVLAGLLLDGAYVAYSIGEAAKHGNYLPAGVFAITNLASGMYELGRMSVKKSAEKSD